MTALPTPAREAARRAAERLLAGYEIGDTGFWRDARAVARALLALTDEPPKPSTCAACGHSEVFHYEGYGCRSLHCECQDGPSALALTDEQAAPVPAPNSGGAEEDEQAAPEPLPLHRTEAGYPNCSTCDGGGCPDCTDPE